MAGKKKNIVPDPDYFRKQRASLLHRHRQVVTFNDQEMAAIELYVKKFKVSSKAAFFREAIMREVIGELEDNHPTLF